MSLVGHMAYPHGLRPGSMVLWRQSEKVTTVLVVKNRKNITVEGAPPFYRSSTPGTSDADFTHVVVSFYGLPWPCIFGSGDTVSGFTQQFFGED